MKFRILYKFFGLAILAFVFQSRSNGPASAAGLQVSGAPGNGTCANSGCHGGNAFDASLDIEFLNSAGDVISQYIPGEDYTVRVIINNGSGTPAAYGFQATARDASGSTILLLLLILLNLHGQLQQRCRVQLHSIPLA